MSLQQKPEQTKPDMQQQIESKRQKQPDSQKQNLNSSAMQQSPLRGDTLRMGMEGQQGEPMEEDLSPSLIPLPPPMPSTTETSPPSSARGDLGSGGRSSQLNFSLNELNGDENDDSTNKIMQTKSKKARIKSPDKPTTPKLNEEKSKASKMEVIGNFKRSGKTKPQKWK